MHRHALAILVALTCACELQTPDGHVADKTPTMVPAPRTTVPLLIDLASCRPRSAALVAPVYNGFWSFPAGAAGEPIRCALPIEAGDTIVTWAVYGRHDEAGPQATTACLQRLEAAIEADTQHFSIGGCFSGKALEVGRFSIVPDEPPSWSATGNEVYSIVIAGSGHDGDRVGAAVVQVMRQ
jgi:hypothetical protein